MPIVVIRNIPIIRKTELKKHYVSTTHAFYYYFNNTKIKIIMRAYTNN